MMSKIAVGYMVTDDRENNYPLVKFVFDDENLANDFIKQYNSAIKYIEDRKTKIFEKIQDVMEKWVRINMVGVEEGRLRIFQNNRKHAHSKYIQICKDTKDNNSPEAIEALNEMKYFDKIISKEQKNINAERAESRRHAILLWNGNEEAILKHRMLVDYNELNLIKTFDLTELGILNNTIQSNPEFSTYLLQR